EAQLSGLAAAASGFFIFAATALRFIEDPRYANPTMRLNQLLSTLNGCVVTSHDRPPAPLDALYTSILNAIPPEVWPTTKRVLGTLLCARAEGKKLVLTFMGVFPCARFEDHLCFSQWLLCTSLCAWN